MERHSKNDIYLSMTLYAMIHRDNVTHIIYFAEVINYFAGTTETIKFDVRGGQIAFCYASCYI